MSFFESFLGGAAQAGTGILQDQMKEEQVQRMAKFQEELAMERQRTINAMNQENKIADEKRANEPLERIGGLIASKRKQEVAAEAPGSAAYQNMQLTGEGTGSGSGGFKGGIENALLSAQDIKDPVERKAALDQIQSQINYQSDGIRSAAPKTRKLTADEAEKAALDDAMEKDPVAYAEYQKRIGAPRRAERREDTREDRAASQDATTNRRLDIQEQFNAERAKHQEAMEKLQMARLDKQDGRQSDQMDKAELQSKRLAITSVLKDIGTQEDKLQVRLADPMLDEKQKAILVSQMKTLDNDRNAAKNFLYEMSGVDTKPVPAAAPKNAWDNATGDVYANGQVIGKAKSPEEAKAMLTQPKPQPSPSTAPVTPPAPAQQFNEAGYADVQSTIEGAKRGDQKAIALLRQLIDRGETSPAQRQQIAKITGQN